MESLAPGAPGEEPRWTSSAKEGIGCAVSPENRVWFTLYNGIISEVYSPFIDQANIRHLKFLVTNGEEFFCDEEWDTAHEVSYIAVGVPAYKIVNTCKRDRFKLTKIIFCDPHRDSLIIQLKFEVLQGELKNYRLYAYVNPHMGNAGYGNRGWVGEYKGYPMLFAERENISMAFASSPPFLLMTTGYAGVSDGYNDVKQNKKLTQTYLVAEEGNVGLLGELDLLASKGEISLSLSFSWHPSGSGLKAKATLNSNLHRCLQTYINEWNDVQLKFRDLERFREKIRDMYRTSTMVLKSHRTKVFNGSCIASLSIPWGYSKGDNDLGGYHLIWPRDLVETAGGLLAAEDVEGARDILNYLMCTQEADGHWAQCLWVEGVPYWNGIQMDETAMPILLADNLKQHNSLQDLDPWEMVRKAAGFIVRNGPVTQEDRWEEDGGYTPFTIAAQIAALLAAADYFRDRGEVTTATYLEETADTWNDLIERWIYVKDTPLAKRVGVEGYYVRITSPEFSDASSPTYGFVPIKNRPSNFSPINAVEIVSADALALVRFGLRAADDPRILNTVKVIDVLLKTETTNGPTWHRYNEDGYGELQDGSAFNGAGKGRGWPLLVGERAHYELALGNNDEALRLLDVIAKQANSSFLLPEQTWDAADIPEKRLFNGRATGSAMPLVWAHAEYIKLVRSLSDNRIFDRPSRTYHRYVKNKHKSNLAFWRFNHKIIWLIKGKILRIETLAPATVRVSFDNWQTFHEVPTQNIGIGIYYADLATQNLESGTHVSFTFFWTETSAWEGRDFAIKVQNEN